MMVGLVVPRSIQWFVASSRHSALCKSSAGSKLRTLRRSSSTSAESSKSMNTRSVQHLLVATSVVGFTASYVYHCNCKEGAKQSKLGFADQIFQIPHVSVKSASTIYQYRSRWFFTAAFPKESTFEKIKSFSIGPKDILVVSFPKSGTTWLQKIVWLIASELAEADVDHGSNVEDLFPYLEYEYPGLAEIAKRPSPRLLKSHLPFEFLPADIHKGKGKVIYIARNPKDVCVSYYHFSRLLTAFKYQGSFKDFFDIFVDGKVPYGPWQHHVLDFWERRNDENMLFLTYESLHTNPAETVRRVAEFIGKSLSDDQIFKIVQATGFDVMSNDPRFNYSWWNELGLRKKDEAQFLRKGIVGDWKNYFTSDMERKIEESCVDPLKRQGLTLPDGTV